MWYTFFPFDLKPRRETSILRPDLRDTGQMNQRHVQVTLTACPLPVSRSSTKTPDRHHTFDYLTLYTYTLFFFSLFPTGFRPENWWPTRRLVSRAVAKIDNPVNKSASFLGQFIFDAGSTVFNDALPSR